MTPCTASLVCNHIIVAVDNLTKFKPMKRKKCQIQDNKSRSIWNKNQYKDTKELKHWRPETPICKPFNYYVVSDAEDAT
jgi:hypothetical protein